MAFIFPPRKKVGALRFFPERGLLFLTLQRNLLFR